MEGVATHHCTQVAAARDHTVVLTEEGYVYTFGLNTYHQLGLTPPVASQVPKQVSILHTCFSEKAPSQETVRKDDGCLYLSFLSFWIQVSSKCLKGKNVIGVAAGRFHTVLWTRDAVYTVGLNGGQLGR